MTYSHTYNAFTLAANDSYAWSTERWDGSCYAGMSLDQCTEEARKEAKIQLDIAIEHIEGEFLQSGEYNENDEPLIRNRTFEEVVAELTEYLPHLETYLYRWMVEAGKEQQDGPTEGGSEPLPEDPEEDDQEPQSFTAERAIKLIRSGNITETDGLTWHNQNGDEITVSLDIESDLYEVVTDPYRFGNVSRSICTEYALIQMILGQNETDYYWVTMENNAWAVAEAPQLQTGTLLPPREKHYRLFTGEVYTNLNYVMGGNAKVKGTWVYRTYDSERWTFGEEYYPIGRVQLFPTDLKKALELIVGVKVLELLANVHQALAQFPQDLQSQWREYQMPRASVRKAIIDTVESWREGEWTPDEEDLVNMMDNIFYHNL